MPGLAILTFEEISLAGAHWVLSPNASSVPVLVLYRTWSY